MLAVPLESERLMGAVFAWLMRPETTRAAVEMRMVGVGVGVRGRGVWVCWIALELPWMQTEMQKLRRDGEGVLRKMARRRRRFSYVRHVVPLCGNFAQRVRLQTTISFARPYRSLFVIRSSIEPLDTKQCSRICLTTFSS